LFSLFIFFLTLCEQPRSKVKKRIKVLSHVKELKKKHLHAVFVKELIKKKRINSTLLKKKRRSNNKTSL